MRSNFEQEMQLLDRALQRKVDASSDARDDFRREYFQLRSFEKLLVHDLLKEKEASEKVSVLNSAQLTKSRVHSLSGVFFSSAPNFADYVCACSVLCHCSADSIEVPTCASEFLLNASHCLAEVGYC